MLIRQFLRPGFYRGTKRRKDEPRAVLCFFLESASNHPPGTARLLLKGTRSVTVSRDLTWLHLLPDGEPDEVSAAASGSDSQGGGS